MIRIFFVLMIFIHLDANEVAQIKNLGSDLSVENSSGKNEAKSGQKIQVGDTLKQNRGTTNLELKSGANFSLKGQTNVRFGKKTLYKPRYNIEYKKYTPSSLLKYFKNSQNLEVRQGRLRVSAPEHVGVFKVIYLNTNTQITTPVFYLYGGQTASFKEGIVLIMDSGAMDFVVDENKRWYFGGELSLVYMNRELDDASLLEEEKLFPRFGLSLWHIRSFKNIIYSLSFTTDNQAEELNFDAFFPIEQRYHTYVKANFGLGATHGDDFEPTHHAFGAGFGRIFSTKYFWIFTDLNLERMIWNFDRGPKQVRQRWREWQVSLQTRFVYRF